MIRQQLDHTPTSPVVQVRPTDSFEQSDRYDRADPEGMAAQAEERRRLQILARAAESAPELADPYVCSGLSPPTRATTFYGASVQSPPAQVAA